MFSPSIASEGGDRSGPHRRLGVRIVGTRFAGTDDGTGLWIGRDVATKPSPAASEVYEPTVAASNGIMLSGLANVA